MVIETTYLSQSQTNLPSIRKFWIDPERMFILKEESDSYLLSNGVFVVPIIGPFKVIRNETRITSLRISDPLADSLFRFIPPSDMKEVEESTRQYSDMTGSSAPDFGLKDLNDTFVKLSDLQGKVILIEFWASWCSPCKRALPIIEQLNLNFKNKGPNTVPLLILRPCYGKA